MNRNNLKLLNLKDLEKLNELKKHSQQTIVKKVNERKLTGKRKLFEFQRKKDALTALGISKTFHDRHFFYFNNPI